jgi:hypothetical protein
VSERFSFSDFVGFFALSFLGDLSPTAHSSWASFVALARLSYLRFWLLLRALRRCFLPGGPPVPPGGVLASPHFFCFAMTAP